MAEFCVIGAGVAGLTIASELIKFGHTVTIYEKGGQKVRSRVNDELTYLVDTPNTHTAQKYATAIGAGGTSEWWGGRCVPFDPVDFSGFNGNRRRKEWPINLHDISKHYFTASKYLSIGKDDFILGREHYQKISENFIGLETLDDKKIERWASIKNVYRTVLSKNTKIYFDHSFRSFEYKNGRVQQAVFYDTTNQTLINHVADYYILCCGGIESTRIILNESKNPDSGFVSRNKIGKNYMGHLSGSIATIKMYGNPHDIQSRFIKADDIYYKRRLQFTDEHLMRNELNNIAFWLENPDYSNPSHRSAILSLVYIILSSTFLGRFLVSPGILQKFRSQSGKFSKTQHLFNIIRNLPTALIQASAYLFKRFCVSPGIPGFMIRSNDGSYRLHFHAEQMPNEESYIKLSDYRDEHESLKASVSLTWSREDAISVFKAHRQLQHFFAENKIGEIVFDHAEEQRLIDQIIDVSIDGFHQIGGLTMGASPKDGVTDTKGAIWGCENLVIAGSALFPSSSQANPTFMICALACYQASELNKLVKYGR